MTTLRTQLTRLGLLLTAVGALATTTVTHAQETITVQSLNAQQKPISVTIPKNPQRVAVLDMAVLDTMDHWQLDDKIVAVPKKTKVPFLGKFFDAKNGITDVGTLKEVSLEALMATRPDVIFISGRLAKKYNDLSKIAPVVYLTIDRNVGTLQSYENNTRELGKIFNQQAQAQKDIEHFKTRLATIQNKSQNKTAIVALVTSAHVNLLGSKARASIITDEFGFKNLAEKANANHGNESSFELLLKKNPDYLFVLDRDSAIARPGAKLAKDVLNNDLVNRMKAVQEGHVTYLNPQAWYLAEGGYQAMNFMFEDVEKALNIKANQP